MAKQVSKPAFKIVVKKRTSIGTRATPKHKAARRSFKAYRGQGRP